MQTLASLDEILDHYDAVLCDIWGVVHDGRRTYAGAADALARARARGKVVVLITNAPKPRDPIPGQLDRLGCPRAAWTAIVTSGDAIREELRRRAPGPMFRIGPASEQSLWQGLGLTFAELDHARFVGVSGLRTWEETPDAYTDVLRRMRAADLELLCANPDIQVRLGDSLVWCAGAIARDYQALGGRVVMAGKPYAPIYELAYVEVERQLGRRPARSRMLCIGDGVPTDVLGANRQGHDMLFIAGGMHGDALQRDGVVDGERVAAALAAQSVHAEFTMLQLA
ncbi:MAG: TIGR01459 family HAD-type hydrolase [Planctomycetes bacterium]|nr:TIGR01459 family HAD-type hydrolase [Planctomycetota bacterium]